LDVKSGEIYFMVERMAKNYVGALKIIKEFKFLESYHLNTDTTNAANIYE
jgi:hypothetical protein